MPADRRHLAILAVAVALVTPRVVAARESMAAGDVDASIEDPRRIISVVSGAIPHTIDLQNKAKAERHVTLKFSGGLPGPFSSFGGEVIRRVVLVPGEHRVVVLPVPVGRFGSLGIQVSETGAENSHMAGYYQERSKGVLVVGRKDDLQAFYAFLGAPTPASDDDEAKPGALKEAEWHSELPDPGKEVMYRSALELPDLLAGYSGLRAVLVLSADLGALSPAQRKALEDYVLTGGAVYFGPEFANNALRLDQWQGGAQPLEQVGLGTVSVCRAKEDCLSSLSMAHPPPVHVPTTGSGSVGRGPFGQMQVDTSVRMLKDVGRVPLNGFLAIILLFSLAIGPGGLFVARRYGRHYLLALIPAIALTTCGGITTYAVAADGIFTIHSESRSVTFLDATNHRAATLAVTAYLASLAHDRLHFPSEVAETFDLRGNDISVDWSDGMALSGNVIPARKYTERATLSVAPSRARLIVSASDAENALGGRVVQGFVNRHGTIYQLHDIASGGRGPLQAQSLQTSGGESELLRTLLASDLSPRFSDAVVTRLCAPLAENEFVALLSDGDFVPTGGLTPSWHSSFNAVRGMVTP